jgi:thiol-disulfide isomerase/thioredoxin
LYAGGAAAAEPRVETASPAQLQAALAPGRARVVHLWASWCRPCMGEWPHLAALLRKARVEVVTLALDDAPARAQAALQRVGAPGRALLASAADAAALLHALDSGWDGALPSTLVLDASGRVALAQHGFTDLEELAAAIDRVTPPSEKRGHARRASTVIGEKTR